MNILVFNAGSSTLKVSLFNSKIFLSQKNAVSNNAVFETTEEVSGSKREAFKTAALSVIDRVFKETKLSKGDISSVGHRIVHGGEKLRNTIYIDDDVVVEIEKRIELAPTHNPNALGCFDAAKEFFQKSTKQIAVFDTAFHRTIPELRSLYPVPLEWAKDHEIRRYGFHGINHGYCARRAAELLKDSAEKLIIAHLGNGCSVTAVLHGISVNTTMGFTPMEGLMMGTRCGSIDPGIILHLINNKGWDGKKLEEVLNKKSGILAISEKTSDMREILEARKELDEKAVLAFDMFVDRLSHSIASLTASLGGLDALIFTGGIGEHSAEVRRCAVENLAYLGLKLDAQANESAVGNDTADATISTKNSKAAILKIRAREDMEIARQCFELASSGVFSSLP